MTTTTVPIDTGITMSPEHMQRANEYTYSRKFIDRYIRIEINKNEELYQTLIQTVGDIYQWLDEVIPDTYESKKLRLAPLADYSKERMLEIVTLMAIECAYCQKPMLFTSITSKLAGKLGWDDKRDAITTVAELLVFLAHKDVVNICQVPAGGDGAKYGKFSIAVEAGFPMSAQLLKYIESSSYLPPMVCKPNRIKKNNQSGYLTHNDSVILHGKTDAPLALDVLNTQNQTALSIDLEFVMNVNPHPNKVLDTSEKVIAWDVLKAQTNELMLLLHTQTQGNSDAPGALYFNHKFDHRGRMYCQGYHINYQGTPYRKAMLEFNEMQYIDVPEQFQTTSASPSTTA